MMHMNENIITAFHVSQPEQHISQVRYSDPNQKTFFLERLNRTNTICVFVQSHENIPVEMAVWNINQKEDGLVHPFKLTQNISATVQQVFPFGHNKAALLANPNKAPCPILKVFDFTATSPVQEVTSILDVSPATHDPNDPNAASESGFSLNDVYITDYDAQKIVWERISHRNGIEIYNPVSNMVTFQYYDPQHDDESDDADY